MKHFSGKSDIRRILDIFRKVLTCSALSPHSHSLDFFKMREIFHFLPQKASPTAKFPFENAKYILFTFFFSDFCRFPTPTPFRSHCSCVLIACLPLGSCFSTFSPFSRPLSLSRALSLPFLIFYGAFYFAITAFSPLFLSPFFAAAIPFLLPFACFYSYLLLFSSIKPPTRFFFFYLFYNFPPP